MTHPVRAWSARLALLAGLVAPLLALAAEFPGPVLRGIERLHVEVVGIHPDFDRYGLTEDEMHAKAAAVLAANGLPVVSAAEAAADDGAARLRIKLNANEDQYAFYFYGVSVQVDRKVSLTGGAETAQTVWSKGQHGVINPSDWRRVYGYVETIVGEFLAEHGRHNGAAFAASRGAPAH